MLSLFVDGVRFDFSKTDTKPTVDGTWGDSDACATAHNIRSWDIDSTVAHYHDLLEERGMHSKSEGFKNDATSPLKPSCQSNSSEWSPIWGSCCSASYEGEIKQSDHLIWNLSLGCVIVEGDVLDANLSWEPFLGTSMGYHENPIRRYSP